MASRAWRVLGVVGTIALKTLWVSLMVLTPLFGFWVASSIAAYENASQWLALLGGLVLFPLAPVGWDLFFVWRRSKRPPRRAILTGLDRLVLRTLLVNGVFLGGVMATAPQLAFRALAVRGDWILDGHHGPVANEVRGFLLGLADQFEQRWHKARTEYGTSDRAPDPGDNPEDAIVPTGPTGPSDPNGWPLPAEPDVQVTGMPDSAQTSVDAVGRYLAERIPDKRRLVKALHDYVVLRLHYDDGTAALRGADRYSKRPPQDADSVFAARTGVCEGYARLMVGLGKAAGVEVAYITGYIRDTERRVDPDAADDVVKSTLEGYLHAWNAVKVDGTWLLVDTTWDDPTGGAETLRTTYLMTPPHLFRYDHLPEEPAWQLIAVPLSAGEFARQPLLSPEVGSLGVTLVAPTRSQITVHGTAEITLDNPFHATISAVATRDGTKGADEIRCTIDDPTAAQIHVGCDLGEGQYEVRLFGAPKTSKGDSLAYFGTILVNSR